MDEIDNSTLRQLEELSNFLGISPEEYIGKIVPFSINSFRNSINNKIE